MVDADDKKVMPKAAPDGYDLNGNGVVTAEKRAMVQCLKDAKLQVARHV